MNVLLAGLLTGSLHVVSGPDHLAAVAPLAIREPRSGLRVGVLWGIGHASGALAVGLLALVARSFIDVHALSSYAELVVGFVLAAIGAWAIAQSRRIVLHRHPHTHTDADDASRHAHADGHVHEHLHVHDAEAPHGDATHRHGDGGAFGIGFLHGAAGTGHLLGVLPALALPTPQAVVYLVAYGLAAVGAMASFGALMGTLGHRLKPQGLRLALSSAGALAIAIGVFWIVTGWPGA